MTKHAGLLGQKIKAINLGLPSFADDMQNQGVEVARVDWQPAAGGDEKMMRLLDRLGT